eukprot:5670409-Prymnesium_polylepis.1
MPLPAALAALANLAVVFPLDEVGVCIAVRRVVAHGIRVLLVLHGDVDRHPHHLPHRLFDLHADAPAVRRAVPNREDVLL